MSNNIPPYTVWSTHEFHAENDDELSFLPGEAILVLEKDEVYNDGWWQGKNRDGFVGLFPAGFVSQTPPTTTTHQTSFQPQLADLAEDFSDDDSTNEDSDKHLSTSTRSSAPDSRVHSKEIHPDVKDNVAELVKAAIAAVQADGTSIPASEPENPVSDPSTFQISKDYENMMHELEQLKESFYEENNQSSSAIENVVENLAISDSVSSSQDSRTRTAPPKQKKHPKQWDIRDVSDWLTEKGFSGEVKTFVENEISGPILLELDLTSLKELGLSSFGKRFNIMHAVADLKEDWEIGILPPSAQRFLPSLTLAESPRSSEFAKSVSSPSDPPGRPATDSGSFNVSRTSVEGFSTYRTDPTPSLGVSTPPPTSPAVLRTYAPVTDVPQHQYAAYSASPAAPVKPERDSRRPYSTVYVDRSGPLPPLTSANSRNVSSPPRSPVDQQLNNPRSAQQSGAYSGHIPTGVSIPRVPPHANLPSRDSSRHPSARDMDQPSRATEPIIPAVSDDPRPPVEAPVSGRPLPKERPSPGASRPGPINCLDIDGSKFLNDADRSGWLNRQGGALKTWRKRWFSMKEGVLYYQKHPSDKRVLGAVPLKGYKIIPDVNIYRGKYCWKIKHERLKSHFFYTDDKDDMKDWLKCMIKATIALDTNAPVISSYAAKTVPIHVAQSMQPRPPSITQKVGRDLPSYVLRGESALSNRNSERGNSLSTALPPPPNSALPAPPVSLNPPRKGSLTKLSQENMFDDGEEPGDYQRRNYTGSTPALRETNGSGGFRDSQFYDDEIGVQPLRNASETINWINYVLSTKNVTVSDLHDDLRTGTMLLMIVEEASGRRYHKRLETPSFTFQMIDNLVSVFKFMESLGIATQSYTVKDVFSGDEQQMVRMCNSIRMAFPAIA